jgi:hypothetical protein
MAPSELKIVGTTTPDAHPGFWQARSEFLGLHGAVWYMIRRTRRGPFKPSFGGDIRGGTIDVIRP